MVSWVLRPERESSKRTVSLLNSSPGIWLHPLAPLSAKSFFHLRPSHDGLGYFRKTVGASNAIAPMLLEHSKISKQIRLKTIDFMRMYADPQGISIGQMTVM